jgi:hypothetical protein
MIVVTLDSLLLGLALGNTKSMVRIVPTYPSRLLVPYNNLLSKI